MDSLISGYQRFRSKNWPDQRNVYESLFERGQRPDVLVVGCIDSRVDPALIFDAGPGQMLTVRNVANLVPPYAPDSAYHGTSAALEFGIRVLEVDDILVLGHAMCGGVKALLTGAPETAQDFVAPWMSLAEPARLRIPDSLSEEDRQQACEHEVIKISLANLMTLPWIAERVAEGKLRLHGAWFNIQSGLLETLQPDGSFAEPSPTT